MSDPAPQNDLSIGIILCDDVNETMRPEYGSYDDMIGRWLECVGVRSAQLRTYRVMDHVFPQVSDRVDAYIISGSRAGVYEQDKHTWITPLEGSLRALVGAGKPVVGICFGHQLLAQAFGGRVCKSPKGWGVGQCSWQVADQPRELATALSEFTSYVYHQDQVEVLPAGAKIIAGNDFCPVGMFEYGEHVLGIQGHPEFSRRYVTGLMNYNQAILGPERHAAGLASLQGDAADGQLLADWALRFINHRVGLRTQ